MASPPATSSPAIDGVGWEVKAVIVAHRDTLTMATSPACERVAAALENNHLLDVVDKCIARTDEPGDALLGLARARPFVDPGLKEPFLFTEVVI